MSERKECSLDGCPNKPRPKDKIGYCQKHYHQARRGIPFTFTRKAGRKQGSPTVLTEENIERILEIFATGASIADICAVLNLKPTTIYNRRKDDPEFKARMDRARAEGNSERAEKYLKMLEKQASGEVVITKTTTKEVPVRQMTHEPGGEMVVNEEIQKLVTVTEERRPAPWQLTLALLERAQPSEHSMKFRKKDEEL